MGDGGERGPTRPGAADRVARSHAQTRTTIRFALAFIAASALTWAADGWSWLPLHLFLAGGLVLAISGVSLMLTVTWSAAPAPPDRLVWSQRGCVAVGAAGAAAGRHLELGAVVVAAAAVLYVAGLVLLAATLVVIARRGVQRRFDPAVLAYVLALAAGTVGVVLGAMMSIDVPTPQLRAAHATVNVLGLVGLVITGTLPFFAATVGRTRMAPHATAGRITAVVGWQGAAVLVTAVGAGIGSSRLAGIGLGAYAGGIVALLALAPRPARRQWRWAGPRLAGLWAGTLWWTVAVAGSAIAVGVDHQVLFERRWLSLLVVAGYAQILWGSLAYLLPMLRGGGPERLSAGFAATRSWVGLAAANLAGVALLASASLVAAAALALWILDSTLRAVRVRFGPTPRTSTAT